MSQASILDVMVDVARKDEKNPIARRHVELFNARQNGYLTEEEMRRICYCDLDKQKDKGELRTQRYIPQGQASSIEQAREWRQARNQNVADKTWLKRLDEFTNGYGLEMSKKEAEWYIYIYEGLIGTEVAAYLDAYGDAVEAE